MCDGVGASSGGLRPCVGLYGRIECVLSALGRFVEPVAGLQAFDYTLFYMMKMNVNIRAMRANVHRWHGHDGSRQRFNHSLCCCRFTDDNRHTCDRGDSVVAYDK